VTHTITRGRLQYFQGDDQAEILQQVADWVNEYRDILAYVHALNFDVDPDGHFGALLSVETI
jgi:hypothetical protein